MEDIRRSIPEERIKFKDQLKEILKRFLPSNMFPGTPKIYRTYPEYREGFINGGGVIEAIGGFQGSYSIGVVCQIQPNGEYKYITTFEYVKSSLG